MTLATTLRPRLRAAAIHIGISTVLLAVPLYLIVFRWYPDFHFAVDGGWQGVRLMMAIDLVLGPLLTLIVFNPAKARRLIVLDLSVIGVIQLGAMAWGIYAIHSQHPIAVNFSRGAFHSITAEPLRIEKTDPQVVLQYSDRRPPLVYVRDAANDDEEARKQLQEFVGGLAEHEDPFFFQPFSANWTLVAGKARTAAERSKESRAFREALPEFLAERGGSETDYRWFPYWGRHGSCTLGFTAAGELTGAVGCELD